MDFAHEQKVNSEINNLIKDYINYQEEYIKNHNIKDFSDFEDMKITSSCEYTGGTSKEHYYPNLSKEAMQEIENRLPSYVKGHINKLKEKDDNIWTVEEQIINHFLNINVNNYKHEYLQKYYK